MHTYICIFQIAISHTYVFYTFSFCIGISQLKYISDEAEIDSVNLQPLTLVESAQNIQSAVQKPNESARVSTDTQPLGVITDVKPKCEPSHSGGHHVPHVSHLVETAEIKDDAKSSTFLYQYVIHYVATVCICSAKVRWEKTLMNGHAQNFDEQNFDELTVGLIGGLRKSLTALLEYLDMIYI